MLEDNTEENNLIKIESVFTFGLTDFHIFIHFVKFNRQEYHKVYENIVRCTPSSRYHLVHYCFVFNLSHFLYLSFISLSLSFFIFS